ncbi:MAG: DNA polymerase I [Oscillospiraceae bacterium]
MKLMILDGNSLVNRAYYGIRPLTTKDGLYTHAIYGFVTTLQRLLAEEEPEALCVAFDLHAPTFRHKADESYKATRKGMPEELRQQMPVLKDVLRAMNIPLYELEGYEADDLIGTVSRKCEAAGWECVAVTGDKDSLQLITEKTRVKLVSTRMGQTTTKDMTEESFRSEYGFDPIHMIDLKALMGDSSDNIPGVPGIGEKTAMALIQKYGSIDALYAAMPEVEAKPAALRKLAEGEESARHSYWLATIVTDAPLIFSPEENLRQPPKPELYDLFLRLEFLKLIEKMGLKKQEELVERQQPEEMRVWQVRTAAEGEKLLSQLRGADHTALLALPDLAGLSLVYETAEGEAITAELLFSRYEGDWNALLAAIFSVDIRKVAHEVKDLTRALLESGLPAEGFIFDTALAAYLLDATAGSYDIQRLFVSYFNEELPKPLFLEPEAFSLMGGGAEAEAAMDSYAAAVVALYGYQAPRLEEWGLHELFYAVELPLCRVLAEMELSGVRVDAGELAAFGAALDKEAKALEEQIYTLAGHPFNINSPKQLGEVLFGEMQLPHGKKTKTGWSTNADVLESLRWQSPIVEDVLQYRQLTKLKSTYADGLLKALSPDGRVRTSFQMTVTATGRLSSTEPNLQNIPTRTELGSEFRRMFVADAGNVLVDADYSQIELRLLAHIADDETMLETFRRGEDIHAMTAARVFGVPLAEVTPLMRRNAKAVNFGIVYGISAFSLSKDIGVSVAEAKAYMDAYFEKFSGVRRYMTEIVEQARAQGYVETLMHRRRALPELSGSNFNLRAFGERVALNMPIQGTAADIMKSAMVRVWRRLRAEGLRAKLILQVHDELIVECPEDEAEQVKRLLAEEMEGAASLRVPLTAEAHSGKNWLEAKE